MDFGEFEGKNYIELQKDPNYQAWIDSNGTLPFPGGESREAFIKRCEQGFYRMLVGIKGSLLKMDETILDLNMSMSAFSWQERRLLTIVLLVIRLCAAI